jgi:hypothetical protein
MGSAMNGLIVGHKIKSYCKQHAGEPYTWQWPDGRKQAGTCPGTPVVIENYCKQHAGEPWTRTSPDGSRKEEGTCPGTLVVTKEKLVEASNSKFRAENVVGYAESSGDTFMVHSERASEMRFHMLVANKQYLEYIRTAGIKTFVYTNDSDQRFTYDLVADHVVTPGVPVPAPAAAPSAAASAPAEEEPLANVGSSDTATKAVASTIPQNAPASSAPATSAPATTTVTVDIPKPCFTDKSGHTVCLAQH